MIKLFTYFLFFITTCLVAQSNTEIADIYLIKADEQLTKNELDNALHYYDKAITLMGDQTTIKSEEIGTKLYFNMGDYKLAKEHAQAYFLLAKDKSTEQYKQFLYLYVDIEEKIELGEKVKAELLAAELLAAKLLKEKQQRKMDSLTKVWNAASESMCISADSIYTFDENGVAVFKSSTGFYGVIDDKGNQLIAPGVSSGFEQYDSKIILFEGAKDSIVKIKMFDTSSKKELLVPAVSTFNNASTNYGKVMLPRENDLFVSYPDNSKGVFVYDLNLESFKKEENIRTYYANWKELKIIKKFNKTNQIKIDKEYLDFGGSLGFYNAFYNPDGSLFGFISNDGTILSSSEYSNLGAFCNEVMQAIKTDGTVVWLNKKGELTKSVENKTGVYKGTTRVIKVNSKYQFVNENDEILKDGKLLIGLEEFLKVN